MISTTAISPQFSGGIRSAEAAALARGRAGEVVEFVQRPREGTRQRTHSRFREAENEIELLRERRAPRSDRRLPATGAERFAHGEGAAVALPFLAQHIAQEIIPGAPRNESEQSAEGVAAYAAAAARIETVLGPVGSVELMA